MASPDGQIAATLRRLELDADALRGAAEAVLSDELYWFPVRHHSLMVARHLEAALLERRPKLVCIEGPAEASDLIPFVTDAKTKPPIAIYSSYRDDDNVLGLAGIRSEAEDVPPRFASWYPLLSYSPEYVALKTAKKIGASAVFVDLPHHALITPHPGGASGETAGGEAGATPASSTATELLEREDDRLFVESTFYKRLAEASGFRSWDEAWDSLFEVHREQRGRDEFRRNLAYFCAAVRATSDPERVQRDGTLERERHMWQTIQREMAARKLAPSQVMVVCGGFHLFLDRADSAPPPVPPAGTLYTTLVPYSFFRISELSGYAAGNRAPQYYQTLWDNDKGSDFAAANIQHIVNVLSRARRQGEALSSADAIAATQTAEMLAQLRGRSQPVLDDLRDALITCCVKGDPDREGQHLLRALGAEDTGTKVGRVTPALGRLPILSDFYAQLDELGLDEVAGKEGSLRLDLDKREARDQARSTFLQRLVFLDVPIGKLLERADSGLAAGSLFKEKWALKWDPGIEHALTELNLYGDSVESAALTLLSEQLAKDDQSAERTTTRLIQAIAMDFSDLVEQVEEAAGSAIDSDSRFTSLSHALSNLLILDRYAVYRRLRRDRLTALIERCFDRACFALPDVSSVPEDQQAGVVQALLGVAEALTQSTSQSAPLDGTLFVEGIRRAIALSQVPYLRGVFAGMLSELRVEPPEALAATVLLFAQEPADRMVAAGDYLDGVMSVSKTSLLLGAEKLLGAIDGLLRAAEWTAFLTMLPRMRSAFERLHERQRDSFSARVAQRYGLEESAEALSLDTSLEAGVMIAQIDARVRDAMKGWEF